MSDAAKILTADQLLAAKAYKTETLEAFGGKVVVRTMPMGGRIAMRTYALLQEGQKIRFDDAKFAAVTLQYGLLEPKVTLAQAEQLVAEQPTEAIEPVLAAIWKLSGLSEESAKNA